MTTRLFQIGNTQMSECVGTVNGTTQSKNIASERVRTVNVNTRSSERVATVVGNTQPRTSPVKPVCYNRVALPHTHTAMSFPGFKLQRKVPTQSKAEPAPQPTKELVPAKPQAPPRAIDTVVDLAGNVAKLLILVTFTAYAQALIAVHT